MKKLIFSLILYVVFAAIGLGWLIDFLYMSSSEDATTQTNITDIETIAKNLSSALSKSSFNKESYQAFALQWDNNNEFSLAIENLDSISLPSLVDRSLRQGNVVSLESDYEISVKKIIANTNNVLSLTKSIPLADDGIMQPRVLLTVFFYVGMVFVVLCWSYPLISRLFRLQKAAKDFGAGNLQRRVKSSALSYIKPIEDEFNAMASRIEELLKDNKMLANAVSHDLKTPLAKLRFAVEVVAQEESWNVREQYIARIEKDLDEMEMLINVLLDYARFNESHVDIKPQKFCVIELIQNMINRELIGIDLNFKIKSLDRSIMINSDLKYFSMVVNNIISNSVKFAKHQIVVKIEKNTEKVNISFEDDGSGIPSDVLSQVTKPFWKSNSQGHGMGMAIVYRLSTLLGMTLEVTNSTQLCGAKITIGIPLLFTYS